MIKGFLDSRIPFIFASFFRSHTMNRLLYILSLVSSIFSTACSDAYRIKGISNISSIDGKTITLMTSDKNEWKLLDSCEVLHGKFLMKGSVDSNMIATLFLDGQPIMPIIVEPGKMDVTISNIMLKVEGTPLNDSLYGFIARKYKLDLSVVEMERTESRMIMNGHTEEEIRTHIDSIYQQLSLDMRTLVCDFIGRNYDNVLGLCGFSMLCNGLPYPAITPLIQSVIDDAPQSFLTHPTIRDFLMAARENMERHGIADVITEQ